MNLADIAGNEEEEEEVYTSALVCWLSVYRNLHMLFVSLDLIFVPLLMLGDVICLAVSAQVCRFVDFGLLTYVCLSHLVCRLSFCTFLCMLFIY